LCIFEPGGGYARFVDVSECEKNLFLRVALWSESSRGIGRASSEQLVMRLLAGDGDTFDGD
jgi:hypothetical protein